MGITPSFSQQAIRAKIEIFQKRVDAAILVALQYLGDNLVKYAKENITFTPQTGNLQNSIGYVVVKNGAIVFDGFGGSQSEGAKQGLEIAMKAIKSIASAYALIIVAGMNYAAKVEAKGYNVILPAELKAKAEFKSEMKRLIVKAEEKAKLMLAA
ncbi:MAG: hypothetical protein AB2L20_11940 [Mangrovibacterium sp.]